jgi:hypothetical protein
MAEAMPLPIACTLSAASLEERAAWLQRLGAAALIEGRREDSRLLLRFRPEAADDVRELVRAEAECCPFLQFEVDAGRSEIVLDVSGPAEAGPVLDDFLAVLNGGR